jgi:hypothetical protein
MGFFEALVKALISLLFIFLGFLLCLWVLGIMGLALPAQVVMVLKAIFVLVAILVIARLFYPWASGYNWNWFGPWRGPPAP